jgi:hypothetical protein
MINFLDASFGLFWMMVQDFLDTSFRIAFRMPLLEVWDGNLVVGFELGSDVFWRTTWSFRGYNNFGFAM